MKKTALVLTYHVKESKRVGGFHYFISFLIKAGFDIDWGTLPVSSSWLWGKDDRVNAHNFVSLAKGITYSEDGCTVRCFTVPLWIPAKLAKKIGLRSGFEFWPSWERLRRKLKDHYDVIIFEGVACQYAKELAREYKNSRIIYRPSDILATFSSVSFPEQRELEAINFSDLTACVDESEMDYYIHLKAEKEKLTILRNPLASDEDIRTLEKFAVGMPHRRKKAVYVGASFCDHDCIEYVAFQHKDCDFYVIGPFRKISHDNVMYIGSLEKRKYEEILKQADVAIAPIISTNYSLKNHIVYGYTGKIITYMKYLLPIIATCSQNYLGIDGFFCVDSKEEFSRKITECLQYSAEDRERLREGYLRAMKVFSEEESKKRFYDIISS